MHYKFWLHQVSMLLMITGFVFWSSHIFAQSEAIDTNPAGAVDADTLSYHLFLPLVQTDAEANVHAADCDWCNPPTVVNPQQTTISFSGYQWLVYDSAWYPNPLGDNFCSWDNVWTDANGDLHLKLTKAGLQWHCAELISLQTFGFGQFQWQIYGQLGQLEPQAKLRLVGTSDGSFGLWGDTNKIDIKFVRESMNSNTAGSYTVYPKLLTTSKTYTTYPFSISGLRSPYSTHRFTWQSRAVLFQSLPGFTDSNQDEWTN